LPVFAAINVAHPVPAGQLTPGRRRMNSALMIARAGLRAGFCPVGWRNHERAVHPPLGRKQGSSFLKKKQKTFVPGSSGRSISALVAQRLLPANAGPVRPGARPAKRGCSIFTRRRHIHLAQAGT